MPSASCRSPPRTSSGWWTLTDTDGFGTYVEAVNALSVLENRQREALRKAVETSTATQAKAKEQMADQQRMYNRAGQEIRHAEGLLVEMRTMLGLPGTSSAKPTPQAGTPLQLVEVLSKVRDVVSWAEESKPVAESLLRTKARLASVPKPVGPSTPSVEASPERKLPVGLIVAALVLIVIGVVIVIVAMSGT